MKLKQAHTKRYFPNCPADEFMSVDQSEMWAEMVLAL